MIPQKALLPLLLLLFRPLGAPGMSFNSPYVIEQGITSGDSEVSVFAERFGAGKGRLHLVYTATNTMGGKSVFYRRESTIGASDFAAPVRVSPLDNNTNISQPDIYTDQNGVAHICYIGPNASNQAVFYARVNGASLTGPVRASPDSTTVAAYPQIAAVKFAGRSLVQPFIAYVGNDPTFGQTDTEVVLLIANPSSTTTFDTVLKLTDDADSTESNLAFDLTQSLPTGGSPAYLIQGAVVFNRGNTLRAVLSETGSSTGIGFGAERTLVNDIVVQSPALVVQSVLGSANGFVGHVAYRVNPSEIQYLQFARLPTGSDFQSERRSGFSFVSSPAYPSLTVVPDSTVDDRFQIPVTLCFYDNLGRVLNFARNTGGLSSNFGLPSTVGGTARPISSFTDTGLVSFAEVSRFDGPKVVATTFTGGANRLRAAGLRGTDFVLITEQGLTTPSPSPTPSVSPSPSPSASATATHSPTATASLSPTASASPTPSPTGATATASPTPSPTIIIPPTVSPTESPSPTASPITSPTPTGISSPTPSQTAAPTLSPTPDVVDRNEVIDTLLGFRPAPNPARLAQGDLNSDGFWDAADIIGFNLP